VLEVANGGEPIDPEQAQTLAEPFRRLDGSADGFGLGLSVVRSVAEAHGGAMTLTAPPSGGLHVVVTLPKEVSTAAHARSPDPGQPIDAYSGA
jgi:two-component system sensor histidine kinase VanS